MKGTSTGWTLWTAPNVNAAESFEPLSVEMAKESGRAEAGFGTVFCVQKIDRRFEGNGGIKGARYCRTYVWNERNQLVSSMDANYNTAYVYGHDGQRSNKYTQNSETLYFNKMWTLHTDSGNNVYGGQTAKNIYLGETRIVTKLNSGNNPKYNENFYTQHKKFLLE